MSETREELIMKAFYNREISRATMLCYLSDDCSKCPTCYIDREETPYYHGDASQIDKIGDKNA